MAVALLGGALSLAVPWAAAVDLATQVIWGKDSGEEWRYATSDDVGDLGASMSAPDFDDSQWSTRELRDRYNPGSGRAYYYRKQFEVDELFRVVGMEIEFQYDDAAVLYLNGQEVYRTIRGNLPDLGEVPLNGDIPADVNVPFGGAEAAYIRIPGTNYIPCEDNVDCGVDPIQVGAIPVDLLVDGTNTWAAILWNRTGSTDVSIDHEFRLVIDRDATAIDITAVPDQLSELADPVSLQLEGESPNPGPITWAATGLPDGLSLNVSSGLIFGQPTVIGNYSVEVTADDGVRDTTISFDWQVVNAPPEVTNPGPQQTPSFSPVNLTIAAVDPDGGPLGFVATGLPPGLQINASTGQITGSSSAEDAYSVTVTVTDDEGADESVSFPWQIAEPPITIVNPGPQSSTWGQATSLQLSASDPAGGNVVLSTEGLPPGLNYNDLTKRITGSPSEIGSYSVLVSGVGPSGQSIISFPWDIPNLLPIIAPIDDRDALEQIGVSFAVPADDPDGGAVSWSAQDLPAGLTIDDRNGLISGVPTEAGVFNVTVTVEDDEGATSTADFAIQVFASIAQPVLINEFVASNDSTLLDEEGKSPDWFELRSQAPVDLNLEGWEIQDLSTSWTFPEVVLPAGGYLVVFASDEDRRNPGSPLHTNFKLSKEGDALTLIDPGGFIIDDFTPDEYPQQFTDVSYGRASDGSQFYLDVATPNAANSAAGSNYEPILRPFTDRLYNVGEPVMNVIDGFDPDGGPISYNLSPLPPGLAIDITTGVISGTAAQAGVYESEVLIIDTENKRKRQPVKWIFLEPHQGPTRLAMNEYNAVRGDRLLIAGEDPAFGLVEGNGGDWFEFVVVEDGLDLRGWQIELWDRDRADDKLDLSSTFVFTDAPQLSSLPSGLIITISEDRPDDLVFDPAQGDWHINLQSNEEDEGAFITADSQESFTSTRSNQNVIIRNAAGGLESPAVGETEAWDTLVGGVSSGETMALCIDPTATVIDGVASYLDNGMFSSYGQPNSCIFVNDPLDPDDDTLFEQDLSTLRAAAQLQRASATVECAGNTGEITALLTNTAGSSQQFSVGLTPGSTVLRAVAAGGSASAAFTGLADGAYVLEVTAAGQTILSETLTVQCGVAPPPPSAAIDHVVSCLAGNGRVDTNIVNTGSTTATYRIEFQGLSPRANPVVDGDWWRMPITGRPDGSYLVVVKRDGVTVSSTTIVVSCDSAPPVVDPDEIQVVNACRAGNGYLLFQFVNPTAVNRGYVIEFEGVPNRSTSAAAYGQSVRAVTGRPDGTYEVTMRIDGVTQPPFSVVIDCD